LSKKTATKEFTTPEFLERVKSVEKEAFEALVKAYNEHLFCASLGMGFDRDTSAELAQNTWDTFVEVAPKFQGKSHIRTFLFGILYNKASEMRRERKKFSSYEEIDDYFESKFSCNGKWISPPINPEKFILNIETGEMIEECLETLPLMQKTAFYLKEIEGESTVEICKIMETSATNLGVLIFRAKNKLRECIEKKGKNK